jgi:phosphoribosyl 1,2-cyclic phosphodiesterase
MKIRILGCHGSDLLVEKGEGLHACRSVGMLINDVLMLDAGTAASALTIEEQQNVQCVLLSHFHIDHLKELPSLADNLLSQQGTAPLVVASIEEVLKGARTHIFNEQIFPDFFCLPTEERPTLQQCVLKLEQETWLAGFC